MIIFETTANVTIFIIKMQDRMDFFCNFEAQNKCMAHQQRTRQAMNIPLIVYKASAGSGKTFTLATEYIKLVVQDPQAYRQILAVTFTNKATEEMKMRILSQLYGIWKGLDSSSQYTQIVCRELDASPEFVAQQAGIALSNLLHNYSYFRINTIDTFFQSVLRNLARELDLTANLRIGLNDVQVEEMAVDELIENLSTKDQVLQWIMKYIMENISDDRSWNIIGQVKQFGRTLFKDYYKAESKRLYEVVNQPHFFESYTKELRSIRAEAKEHMKELADSFFKELNDAGFDTDDLSYGKTGIAGMFLKMRNGVFDESIVGKRIKDSVGQPEKWYKKSHPRGAELNALAAGPLGRMLQTAIDEQPVQWKRYKSADLTLRHLNQLRLLDSIEKKVRDLIDMANRFLLSDTQQLLHDLIDNSDSPFIFEKIGTQLEHIMIDEFQDTSTVQWKNFKVLLRETMSHEGTENLIVGDVKQSIYRWRSGDWRLLHNIRQEFPLHQADMLQEKSLDTNYRSSRRVIAFNNAFFTKAAEIEEADAYSDVAQKIPDSRADQGYIDITLLSSDDYQEEVLALLVEQTRMLLANGMPTSDIAILVRSNHLIPLIANYFMEQEPGISLVSDEAFRLDASPAIQIIIQALRLLVHPDDDISKAYLARMHAQQPLHQATLDELLPKRFTEQQEALARLPLYELAERLCDIFELQKMEGQSAYLFAFYDQVANYVNEQTTDIAAFLNEWDETLCSLTIQSPEVNGIRLISIHKSKGLEFPHVLIPFCDWKMEHSDILWCRPTESPFNQLPIVPIDYSQKGLKGTIYEAYYNEEHAQTTVDNLNLLYVAFTRASESLYVIGKRGAKNSRSILIEQTLPEIVDTLEGATLEGLEDVKDALHFVYGTAAPADRQQPARKEQKSDKLKNVFLQDPTPLPLRMETYSQKTEFKQSNDSRNFATEPDNEQQQQTDYIKLGCILHNIFSSIRTKDDIDNALQRMELDGILYDQELSRERLENMIRKRLDDPRVADWYSDRWTLFNECTILSVDPQTNKVYERRPDRVMTDGNEMIVVDFKFGRPLNQYHQQVREYMELLRDMGYKQIRGFLWYVYSNNLEEVK